MKIKLFILFPFILFMALSCADRNSAVRPPQKILNSYESRFKNTRTQWEMSGQDYWVAAFKQDGHAVKAYFDLQGKWQKTETELSSSELPSVVIKTIVGAFHGSSIDKSIQVQKSGEGTSYLLTLKSGRQVSTVELSADGVIIGGAMFK